MDFKGVPAPSGPASAPCAVISAELQAKSAPCTSVLGVSAENKRLSSYRGWGSSNPRFSVDGGPPLPGH